MNRLGFGVSYFNNPSENFGSKWEFHSLLKFGMIRKNGDWYLLGGVDHWSTGGLTKINAGETFGVVEMGMMF